MAMPAESGPRSTISQSMVESRVPSWGRSSGLRTCRAAIPHMDVSSSIGGDGVPARRRGKGSDGRQVAADFPVADLVVPGQELLFLGIGVVPADLLAAAERGEHERVP